VDGSTKWVLGDVQFEGEVSGRRASPDEIIATEGAVTASVMTTDGARVNEVPIPVVNRTASVVNPITDTGSVSRPVSDLPGLSGLPGSVPGVAGAQTSFLFNEVVFGVTSEVSSRVGGSSVGNAPFIGLVKERAGWIRPTFLGQTDITSFALDFNNETLTLSRADLIPTFNDDGSKVTGVLKMVDLRELLGAPVFHYAVKVQELWINGGKVRADRPIYVVLDSGTTGCLVDKELFYNTDFSLGTFECHMRIRAEDGSRVTIGSSLRTCQKKCLFLVTPIEVPWQPAPGVEKNAYVIFAGLAFMFNQGSLTIDVDSRRMRLGGYPGPADR